MQDLREILREEFSDDEIDFIIENDVIGELVVDDIVQVIASQLQNMECDFEELRKIVSKFHEEGFSPSEVVSILSEGELVLETKSAIVRTLRRLPGLNYLARKITNKQLQKKKNFHQGENFHYVARGIKDITDALHGKPNPEEKDNTKKRLYHLERMNTYNARRKKIGFGPRKS